MDWAVVNQVLNYVGIPTIIGWFLYDRKRILNEVRTGSAAVTVAEGKAPLEVRTSSVLTLEAEIVALQKSFETDRKIKETTISYLEEQLVDARSEIDRKDVLIDALKKQVRTMMGEADDLKRRLTMMEHQLDQFQKKPM